MKAKDVFIIAALTVAIFSAAFFIYKFQQKRFFCLGGVEYFEHSQMPIFDRAGHQVECEEGD